MHANEKIFLEHDNPLTARDARRVQTRLCGEIRKVFHQPTVDFGGALKQFCVESE